MRGIIAFILCISCYHAFAQNTFDLVDHQGKPSTVEAIMDAAKDKKFVFFGEMHGEAASHQLELELVQQLYARYGNKLVLGMEMFETDVQPIIDEYWKGWINTRSFESEARIWGNYADYRPIVEFARAHQIPLIATNVPRRYANAVYHQGIGVLDSLSDYARSLLPPLPLMVDSTLATYQDLKKMMPGSQAGENMLFSQALKDASMAHQMLSRVADDQVFIHLNGAYHTKNREGILSFLRETPSNHILTIATVSDEGDGASQADFLLLIPAKKERKRKESKREQAAKEAVHPVPKAISR